MPVSALMRTRGANDGAESWLLQKALNKDQ
jgi:hypothetical protein